MAEPVITIFSGALGQSVLVFVLIFTVVFAVLQKSKILGDGKKQIDALVSLAIALLAIGAGYALNLITQLAPFLSVSLVIILVFMLLVGVFAEKEMKFDSNLRIYFGVAAFIAVTIAVLYFSNSFDAVYAFFTGNSSIVGNILLIVVIIAAIWASVRDWK